MVPGLTAIRPGTQYTSETLWKKKRMLENSIGSVGGMTTAAAQTETAGRQPGPWTFILDHKRAPYGLSANDRAHYMVKAGATADIRLEVMAAVRALHIGVLEKIRVEVVWVVSDRRNRDSNNIFPLCKAIEDGIASNSKGYSAHLVDDDDDEHVERVHPRIRYEKGVRPHFQVTITDIGGEL